MEKQNVSFWCDHQIIRQMKLHSVQEHAIFFFFNEFIWFNNLSEGTTTFFLSGSLPVKLLVQEENE